MMIKIVTLFLVGMAVLAMLGRLRFPGAGRGTGRPRGGLPRPRTCPDCGRLVLTGGPCRDCGEGPGRG